jgi:hypothetical protein
MSTENIIEINPRAEIAKRLRQKLDAWRDAKERWAVALRELASELYAARKMHSSNQAFSIWLAENELDDIGKDDRAALIGIGSRPELSAAILEETGLRSPESIWQILKSRSSSEASEDAALLTSPPKIEGNDLPAANSSDPPARIEAVELRTMSSHPAKAAVPSRSPFRGWARADEVTAIYLDGDTRTLIGKAIKRRGGREIWDLILKAIDEGFLTPTRASISKMGLRSIFPSVRQNYSSRFNLTNPKDRAEIHNTVFPAAIASREALAGGMENLESIVSDYRAKRRAAEHADIAAKQLEKGLTEMAADEQEIIMFGKRLWPSPPESPFYGYRELRSAIWFFCDLDKFIASGQDIESRAITIRLLVGHLHNFSSHELEGVARDRIENLVSVVHTLSRLFAKSPEGECKFPPLPKREDEW